MLAAGFHYNVSDMDGYVEHGWSRQQVEPVDLSCASSTTMSRGVSGYGEPLDLSTSRRAHGSGYDMDQYYTNGHQQYYSTPIEDEQCRRWMAAQDGYYNAPYSGATCNESAPSWSSWNPYVDLGVTSSKGYSNGSRVMPCQDPVKTGVPYSVHSSYADRSACAFSPHRKRDVRHYPDPTMTYSRYATRVGADRSVYHTNGGSCKYAQNRTYASVHQLTESPSSACPEVTSQYSSRLDNRKQQDLPVPSLGDGANKEAEGIPVFVSNCKHFAGGLVVSRKECGSPLAEVLPPISIPDFEFNCERAADGGEKPDGDDSEQGPKCPVVESVADSNTAPKTEDEK